MNVLLFALLLWPAAPNAAESPRLTRILYDVELVHGDQRLTVDVVLNLSEDQQFSISCRKNPGGLLFTYWATAEVNYVVFPKMEAAFRGLASQTFGLFPGGPEMSRDQWLLLLYRRTSGKVGGYEVIRENGWRVLSDPEADFILRWRETRRLFKTRYSSKVLEPQYSEFATFHISEMKKFWENQVLEP